MEWILWKHSVMWKFLSLALQYCQYFLLEKYLWCFRHLWTLMMMCQLPPGGVGFAGFFTTEAEQSCDGRKLQSAGSGTSGSTPALQEWGSEFKPQYCQKKNSQKEIFRNLASVCKHDFILLLVSQGTSLSYFAPLYEKGIFEWKYQVWSCYTTNLTRI
jgi:hypothetical protein